jgi:hypothetical protein
MNLNSNDINKKIKDKNHFLKSVIGSVVATYCLQIGDRHHKNIILINDSLCHIDLDWSLGKLYLTEKYLNFPTLYLPKRIIEVIIPSLISKENLKKECLKAFNALGNSKLNNKRDENEFLKSFENSFKSNSVNIVRNYFANK